MKTIVSIISTAQVKKTDFILKIGSDFGLSFFVGIEKKSSCSATGRNMEYK